MSEEFFIASTEYGQVRGARVVSDLDMPYIRFLGIPYAKPPVGERRFQSAERPDAWAGVLDALAEPQPCAGKNNYIKQFVGSDDCLYLNVYTRSLSPSRPAATIVYIHGGGFYSGSSTLHSYSPDYLLASDVVLVVLNYRLGPLGFLRLADSSLNVPGNAGMKDQQLAMRFVRDNIRHFGGDPDNVTLMGHSSGATCVALHCVAESSRGLFHRAAIMSGSPISPEGSMPVKLDWANRLAVKLGYDGNPNDESEILKFLNGADVLKMAEMATKVLSTEECGRYGILSPFFPTVEDFESESSFLTVPPKELFTKAWSNDIDIMIGGTKDEGLGLQLEELDIAVEIAKEVNLDKDDPRIAGFVERVKDFYFKNFPTESDAFVAIRGDTFRWLAMMRTVKARAQSGGKGKTFLYSFHVDSPTQNHYRNRHCGPGTKGVGHADELSYLWKNGQGDVPPRDSMEFEAIMRFTSAFTSFAATGDPNNAKLGDISWKPAASEPFEGLVFDRHLEFKPLEEAERIRCIWEPVFRETDTKYV